ncbi:MAG: restriction endonuclease [Actinobacteria bacterium]|nr:restriction endonuclease [Actinomycetota bacterium]
MPDQIEVPTFKDLMWPTLQALDDLGGSGTIQEIFSKVLELNSFSEEQLQRLHRNGPETEIEYRLAWARTYLKFGGAIDNSRRGVWSLQELGRELRDEDMASIVAEYRAGYRRQVDDSAPEVPSDEPTWKERLLEILMTMEPAAFERLARRLLREAGFVDVTVTGRSGDGGIDGTGVYQLSLVSFPVVFQCKRYRGSVGPTVVRDFRGAMVGRGDKGLLITTGSFSRDARAEATRTGAPPIDLIDGDRLCDLLKEFSLGLERRPTEEVSVIPTFFESL